MLSPVWNGSREIPRHLIKDILDFTSDEAVINAARACRTFATYLQPRIPRSITIERCKLVLRLTTGYPSPIQRIFNAAALRFSLPRIGFSDADKGYLRPHTTEMRGPVAALRDTRGRLGFCIYVRGIAPVILTPIGYTSERPVPPPSIPCTQIAGFLFIFQRDRGQESKWLVTLMPRGMHLAYLEGGSGYPLYPVSGLLDSVGRARDPEPHLTWAALIERIVSEEDPFFRPTSPVSVESLGLSLDERAALGCRLSPAEWDTLADVDAILNILPTEEPLPRRLS